uniref:Uncharacterized protein n=1 Tax=Glossina pallidipes TaxID=7398 RepID=A0A1A9ZUX0_GLOPL
MTPTFNLMVELVHLIPDYDDIDAETRIKLSRGKSDKGKDNKKYDDPYYCGLRARVPNFVKSSSKTAKDHMAVGAGVLNTVSTSQSPSAVAANMMNTLSAQKKTSMMMPMHPSMHAPPPPHMHPHHIQQQQMMAMAAVHAVQHPVAAAAAAAAHHHLHQHSHPMWQTRSFESGIDADIMESPYNHIYGRLPLPTRGYIPTPRSMYIGEWD